jgi:ankyrin repeat protein
MALAGGHLAASKLLIEKGANVNAIVDGGGNLLFFIAPSGKEDLVELLLKNGAKVNHKNKYGDTPLDEAADEKIADLLRKHGGKTGEELRDHN